METKPEQVDIKKNGSKKKKWVLGSIVALIVLGVFGATMASTVIAKVSPDKYILLSMLQMKKIADKEDKNLSALHPINQKRSLSLNLKEINGGYDDYLKEIVEGSGVSLSVANSEAGDIIIDTGFKKNGTSLMDLSVYSSKDKLGIKIPGLLDQYVMADLAQFKQQYDQSDLSYYMGDIEQNDVDLFNDYITQARNALSGQFTVVNPEFNEDIEELLIELVKNASIKHTGKTKVSINNKRKAADGFSVVIDSGDMRNFIKGVTKSAIKNTDLINIILTYTDNYSLAEIEDIIDDASKQMKLSDIEITCAIDKRFRMVSAELSTTTDIYDEKVKLKSDYTLSGGDSIYDQMEANLSLDFEYEKLKLTLERDKIHSNKKTKTSEEIVFKVREDNEQLFRAIINLEQDLKAKEDNFALSSKITVDGDANINFKLSGDFSENKSDGTRSLDANKIEFKVEEYGEITSLHGSGSFKVENLNDQSIAISDKQQLDLFSIGSSEMFDIGARIGRQFYDIRNFFYYIN